MDQRSSRVRRGWLGSLVGLAFVVAGAAHAVSFPLDVEFDDGTTGNFGNVEVTEVGGDLEFVITVNTAVLGAEADLHEFYFNLPDVTNVSITSTDTVTTPYDLDFDPSVSGGAGTAFIWGVNLGSGAGPNGNGVLQTVTFTLSADTDLTVDDLRIPSVGNEVTVFLAAHVQGTDFGQGGSETVGSSTVPEPATFLLGVLGLAWFAKRAHPTRRNVLT